MLNTATSSRRQVTFESRARFRETGEISEVSPLLINPQLSIPFSKFVDIASSRDPLMIRGSLASSNTSVKNRPMWIANRMKLIDERAIARTSFREERAERSKDSWLVTGKVLEIGL